MVRYTHGGDIYHEEIRHDFSINLNPLGMPAGAVEAAVRGVYQSDRYPDPHSSVLLENAAEVCQVPAEWITAGSGASELLFALIRVLGRKVVTAAPTFAGYREAAEGAGLSYREINLNGRGLPGRAEAAGKGTPERRAAGRDDESTAASETDLPETDLLLQRPEEWFRLTDTDAEVLTAEPGTAVILCNPNNPTGQLISQTVLRRILKMTAERDQILIMDESFLPLSDGAETDSLIPLLERAEHLVVLRSLTKQFAMPGLRLGLMFTANQKLAERVRMAMQPWNVSIPAQMAGAEALKDRIYREQTVPAIREAREELFDHLRRLPGVTVIPSDTCYLLMRGDADLQQRLRGEGILIRDCSDFGGLEKGWFRIAVRSPEENRTLTEALRQIDREGQDSILQG